MEAQILAWEFQFIKEKKKVRKKERKHAFDQENDPEKKRKQASDQESNQEKTKNDNGQESNQEKKKKTFIFS